MKKVYSIVNNITGKEWGPLPFFNDQEPYFQGESDIEVQARIDAFLLRMHDKASQGIGWGWSARRILKSETPTLPTELIPLVLVETDEYWDLDKEYTVSFEDETTEYDAELQEIIDKEATVDQIKAAYDIVDGWTSLNDINITFLKKFFKYLISYSVNK